MKRKTMIQVGKRLEKRIPINNLEVKTEERNGVSVGIIEGYASTFDLDRGDDIILPGAFAQTLENLKREGRVIRMLFGHDYDSIIGGFPSVSAFEDDKGLFVRGEINITPGHLGEWVYGLAKMGVLSDFSIGFSIDSMDDIEFKEDNDRIIRVIKKVNLWEISVVPEPMNARANITSVKQVVPFQDLPLAERDREWDSSDAVQRVRSFTGSTEAPSNTYRNAFLWYDEDSPEEFGSYKLPIADVIDGELRAVPRAIFAAAAAMLGARGGVDLPATDRDGVVSNIERYYDKIGLPSPFNDERSIDITITETCQNIKDVEELLKFAGFTASSRKMLISVIKASSEGRDDLNESDENGSADDEMKALFEKLDNFTKEQELIDLTHKLKL